MNSRELNNTSNSFNDLTSTNATNNNFDLNRPNQQNERIRENIRNFQIINLLNSIYTSNVRQINDYLAQITIINDNIATLNSENNQLRNLLNSYTNNNSLFLSSNNNSLFSSSNNILPSTNISTNNIYNTSARRRFTRPRINRRYQTNETNQINQTTLNTSLNDTLTQLFNSFLQPVPVYPTQEQISNATRNVRYCDILSPINTSCPISTEEFDDNDYVTIIRHCGHIFNSNELNRWFRQSCICPVCRYDIRGQT